MRSAHPVKLLATLKSEKEVVHGAGVAELTHLHDWTNGTIRKQKS